MIRLIILSRNRNGKRERERERERGAAGERDVQGLF